MLAYRLCRDTYDYDSVVWSDAQQKNNQNSTEGAGLLRPEGHPYTVGRPGHSVVYPGDEGKGIGSVIDDYVPGGHTFGTNHDALVDYLTTDLGLPDTVVNIPTMAPVYIYSIGQEVINVPFRIYDSVFDGNTAPFTHSHSSE